MPADGEGAEALGPPGGENRRQCNLGYSSLLLSRVPPLILRLTTSGLALMRTHFAEEEQFAWMHRMNGML